MTNDKTLKIVGAIAVVGIAAAAAGYLLTHQGTSTQQPSTTQGGQGTTPTGGQAPTGGTQGGGTTGEVTPPTPETQPTNETTPTVPPAPNETTPTTPQQPVETTPVQGTVDLSTVLAIKSNVTLDAIKKDIAENPSVWKVVVGENAKAVDVLGAAEVATALQYLAKKENKVPIDLSGVKVVLEKESTKIAGEIPLYKDTAKLYLEDDIAEVKPKITYEKGKVEGDEDDYKYRVELWPNDKAQILFKDKPDTDTNDPVVMVIGGEDGDEPIFTVKVKFETGEYLNLTDAKGSEIKILGKTFYLDKDDDGNVVLRAAASKVTLNAGESTEFEGKTIKVVDIVKQGDTYYVKVSVDGKVSTIKVDDDDEVNGVYVYVKGAYVSELEDNKGYAELVLGGEKVVLKDGDGIEVNGELDKRVIPYVKKDNDGKIKEIDFDVYVSDDSDENYIEAGKEFTPVLFDTIKLVFGKVNLKEGQKVELTPSGDKEYKLKITDWRGKSKTLTIAKLEDNGNVYMLEDKDKLLGTIIGTKDSPTTKLAVAEKEYFAVFDNQTKESYLYKVDSISIDSANNKADVTLKDEISGETVKLEDIPYGDGSSTEDWDVGHFVFKVYVNSSSGKLTFKNVDLDDSNSVLKDELKLYLQNEVILDAIQDNIKDNDNETEVKVVLKKDYAGVDEAEPNEPRLLEITIDNKTNELDDPTITVYDQIDETSLQSISSQDKGDDYEVWLNDLGVYVERYKNDDGLDRVSIYVPDEVRTYDVKIVPTGEAKTEKITKEVKIGEYIDDWKVADIEGVPHNKTEVTLQPLVTGVAVLDSRVSSTDNKLIAIGGPDVNRVTAEFLGVSYPTQVTGLTGGLIKAVELNGRVAVLIMGDSADATRMAAREFALYLTEDRDASAFANATAVRVSGTAEAPTAEKLQ